MVDEPQVIDTEGVAPRQMHDPVDGLSVADKVTAGDLLDPLSFSPAVSMSDEQRIHRLSAAWTERDFESLAALAELDAEAALAGWVLAGYLAQHAGDARANLWLGKAFDDGRSPETDPLLAPHLDAVSFRAVLKPWLDEPALPCTREALGLAVASGVSLLDDWDEVYRVLLELPTTPRVAALRSLAAVRLHRWERAVAPVAGLSTTGTDPVWGALLAYAQAQGAAQLKRPELAVDLLGAALTDADLAARTDLCALVLFERAAALRNMGRDEDAWADLTTLLSLDPSFPGAYDALKAL